jgi:hypothetical protein
MADDELIVRLRVTVNSNVHHVKTELCRVGLSELVQTTFEGTVYLKTCPLYLGMVAVKPVRTQKGS